LFIRTSAPQTATFGTPYEPGPPLWPGGTPLPEAVSQEAKAAIVLFFSLLDEQ
jgi:hypothetical protein